MDIKAKKLFRIILASIIIGGTVYVSFKYLMKGPPFMKVAVLLLIAIVVYFTVDLVLKKGKKDKYGK